MMKLYELIKPIDYFSQPLLQPIQRKSIKVMLFLNFASTHSFLRRHRLFLHLSIVISILSSLDYVNVMTYDYHGLEID